MGSQLYTLSTVHFVQAAGAAFLAVLLARFHRTYGHSYLREWSRSWASFCVYVLGALVAVLWTAGGWILGLPAGSRPPSHKQGPRGYHLRQWRRSVDAIREPAAEFGGTLQ